MVYDDYSDDINKIYKMMKRTSKDQSYEQEGYYKFYKSLITNSSHYCQFSNARLVKTIDETWVEAIENAIPAITNCIQNPRKYIEEDREVVNIAMARNITTESLRHLLQHSNYIDEYRKDGTVIPNKILNIYKEESLSTYENRFICTLIMILQQFVNERYDAIFEESKDELGISLELNSTIQNYTEIMDYSLKIKFHDKETDIDNEMECSDIFSRIDKIHRQVNMLVTTGFVKTMRRFPQVRNPIVKTNVIKKNQDYKECYNLWDFLNTYHQVGYQINLLKQSPNIPLDFEQDLYDSIFYHYAMMHSYAQGMDIMTPGNEGKRNITISYIRTVLEEIADGMQLSDDNLRKLIVNELTEIQRRRRKERDESERILKKKKKSKGNNNEKQVKKRY